MSDILKAHLERMNEINNRALKSSLAMAETMPTIVERYLPEGHAVKDLLDKSQAEDKANNESTA